MNKTAAIACVFALLSSADAQPVPGRMAPVRSSSGQFVVFATPGAALPARLAGLAGNTNYIVLEPSLLAVSCERIKQKLWLDLGANAPWRGRIFLKLHTAGSADELVTIVSDKFRDGWSYRVELPNLLERERFMRAMVQVLLSEMANRDNNGTCSAEIPLWLVEGFAREKGEGVAAGGE